MIGRSTTIVTADRRAGYLDRYDRLLLAGKIAQPWTQEELDRREFLGIEARRVRMHLWNAEGLLSIEAARAHGPAIIEDEARALREIASNVRYLRRA